MYDVLSQQAFERACSTVGARDGSAALHAQLITAWNEPQRFYHTLQHLQECLELAHEQATAMPEADQAVLSLALWFHDAVYDVRAHDNEERSAQWAREALPALGASAEFVRKVEELILATRHLGAAEPPRDPLVDLMLDIDLAILAAASKRFAEYDLQIGQEYSWVPPDQFHTARRSVLRGFLAKARAGVLYRTSWGQTGLTPCAVANLAVAE